jgi:lysylphosphatidylglycerol synthetase-like protein (DUF2156 family)
MVTYVTDRTASMRDKGATRIGAHLTMTQNIGSADRVIRLVAGVVLLLLPLLTGFAAATPWLWWGAVVVGLVLIVTGLTRSCPAYALLGIRTCAP